MGQDAKAEAVLRRYYEQNPTKPRERAAVHGNLALAYERAARNAQGVDKYVAVLLFDPGKVFAAYARVASLEVARKKYEQAVEQNTIALGLYPDDPLALRNRSVILRELERFDGAERDISRAIELDPQDAEFRYVLGYLLEIQERFREAIEAYSQAIERDPKMREAWLGRAAVYKRLRQYDNVLGDLNEVIRLKPDENALYQRAIIHAIHKNYGAALDDLNRILLNTGRVDVKWVRMRGEMYGRLAALGGLDAFELSEADLAWAIELDPQDPVTWRNRAVTRMRAKKWREAINDFKKCLELNPKGADAAGYWNDIAEAYHGLGDEKVRLEALNRSLAIQPRPNTYLNRGQAYLRRGDHQLAEADFNQAAQIAPHLAAPVSLRGLARLRQGRFEEAVADLTRTLAIAPQENVYETLVLRALANHARGETKTARADLERVANEVSNRVRGKFAVGMLASLDKRFPDAIVNLSDALGDDVLRPFALQLRARAWLGVGGQGLSAALADADRLVKELPQDGLAYLEAARIHTQTAEWADAQAKPKMRNRALDLLDTALKLQPDLRKTLVDDAELKPLRDNLRFKKLAAAP
jgi:tetratricopeptide (TPR) repeat protein